MHALLEFKVPFHGVENEFYDPSSDKKNLMINSYRCNTLPISERMKTYYNTFW